MENSNLGPVETQKSSSKIWIILILVLLIGLGAVFYYFDFGGLFKGQIKLNQSKNDCVRVLKLSTDKTKVAQCLKSYPELAQNKGQNTKSTTQSVSTPKKVETASTPQSAELKYGFDNKPFNILGVLSNEADFSSMVNPGSQVIVTTPATKIYFYKGDTFVTASSTFSLPSYNDENMPPMISLPVGLELCTFSNKCAVIKQESVSLSGSGVSNSGSMAFTKNELYEAVQFLGLNSGTPAKFRLWITEPPSNEKFYTEFYEVELVQSKK